MTRFTDTVATTLPKGAGELLKAIAADRHTTPAQYVRQAVMERLERDKPEPRPVSPIGGFDALGGC